MPESRRVYAHGISEAARDDPGLALPLRPRSVDGLTVVPVADGLLVHGAPQRQLLRGHAALALVPRLLEAADGSCDHATLAAHLGISPQQLLQAVALLFTRGLLEEGGHGPAPEVPGEVERFLSRNGDRTRARVSGGQAAVALAGSAVRLTGGPVAGHVARMLRASGLGRVELNDAGPDGSQRAPFDLLVAVDVASATSTAPVLHASVEGSTVTVGPLVELPRTPCAGCARIAVGASATTDPVRDTQAAALIADEVLALVCRVFPIRTHRAVASFDLENGVRSLRTTTRRPGCPTCSPLDGTTLPAAAILPYWYEQAIEFPDWRYLDPKDHQAHYQPANIAAQRDRRVLRGPRLDQPPATQLPRAQGQLIDGVVTSARRQPLDAGGLSALLLRVAGLRPARMSGVSRWAPTGGNLGSVHADLLVAGIEGLDDGCYAYEPHDHVLVRRRSGSEGVAAVLGRPVEAPVAVVVLAAAIERVASKYGPLAYRIAHLDAGCALAQLRVVSDAFGWSRRLAGRPAEADAVTAGLRPTREPITTVCLLTPGS